MPHLTKKTDERNRSYAGLFVLLAFFVALRMGTLGHLLMWDEAWNIFSIRAHAFGQVRDPFYWLYYFHPPLYVFCAEFLLPLKDGFDVRLQWLSLFFSAGAFVAVYYLAETIGGWKYSLFTGLSLVFMPGAIAYSTWIKRDSLAVLCGTFAILLLLKKRLFWSFLLIGLSLLSKENGAFFMLAAVILIFVLNEKKPLLKVFFLFAVVAASSAWWYIFFSEMTKYGIGYFFTETDYSLIWSGSWTYYLKKLVSDTGWINILFLIAGSYYALRGAVRRKAQWAAGPVLFLSVYVPISFLFILKPPWLNIPAFPGAALLIGAGMLWLFEKTAGRVVLRGAFYVLLISSLLPGAFFSYEDYHSFTYPHGWPGAGASRDIAAYLNRTDDDDAFMITEFTYWDMPICPIFLFYNRKDRFKTVRFGKTAKEILKTMKDEGVSYLVIVGEPQPTEKTAFIELSRDVYALTGVEPEVVGWSYVWDMRESLKNSDE
jgi:4-amino-4-deoxy-L-arabinose transferase-like glycosyltransferase